MEQNEWIYIRIFLRDIIVVELVRSTIFTFSLYIQD